MGMPEPGTPEYEKMLEFMRADLLSNMEHSKLVDKLVEMTSKQFALQGKDFKEEFEKWKKQQGR